MGRLKLGAASLLLFMSVALTQFAAGIAWAGECSEGAGTVDNGLLVDMTCGEASGISIEPNIADPVAIGEVQYIAYRWVSVCQVFDPGAGSGGALDCQRARACTDPVERLWTLWGQTTKGTWDPLGAECFGRPPTAADTPVPTVTPGVVLTALRKIGLPAVEARTQPAGKTLVNFETIFYAQPQTFARTITLLGQRVDVEARPTQFIWHHGDGTTASTTTPGAPYPAKDVTYEYTDAHQTVQASVDVVYTARFRVDGGPWQDIPETVTIAGPATPLRVSEATAVLSGSYG